MGPRTAGCKFGFAVECRRINQHKALWGESNCNVCLRLHCAHEGSSGRAASMAGGGGGGGGAAAAAAAAAAALPFRLGSGRLTTVRQPGRAGSGAGGSSPSGGSPGGGPGGGPGGPGGGGMSSSGRYFFESGSALRLD